MADLPGLSQLFSLPSQSWRAIEASLALVPRVVTLVGETEALVARVSAVVTAIETIQERADRVVERTDGVVTESAALIGRVTAITDRFEPTLDRLEPIARRIAQTTSPDEVEAMVQLIDVLPELATKLHEDILPVLDTLGTVAPDLRDLLDVSRELNEIIGSVPGLGRMKRKVEAQHEAEGDQHAAATHTAAERPSASPDRG